VREVAKLGGDVHQFVSSTVEDAILQKLKTDHNLINAEA